MGISQLADIADLIAAVAVIGSLVFVGLQVRRGARETRLSNFQALAVQASQWAKDVAGNAELSEIYAGGLRNFERLSGEERTRFNMLMMSILIIIELFFIQQMRQMQSTVAGDPPYKLLLSLISQDGFVAWWQTDRRVDLGDEMTARIDGLIAEREK